MRLDFLPSPFGVPRGAGDLEDGVAVAAWSYDISARLLLDAFYSGAFGSDHQTHDAVGHPHLYGGLARERCRWRAAERDAQLVPGGPQHGEVLCSRDDFTSGQGHVLFAAGDEEDWFFASDGGLDVGVRLCTQSFDFATC